MAILTSNAILSNIDKGNIKIEPFKLSALGSNSYDVHLSKYFATYKDNILDAKKDNELNHFEISEEGFELQPNTLYLATTVEYTETHNLVPYLEGKSSTGRLGIQIHVTAGKGDLSFCNYWTLELVAIKKVIVYPNMPIGQLTYFTIEGKNTNPYNKKEGAKYNQVKKHPQSSKMFKNKW